MQWRIASDLAFDDLRFLSSRKAARGLRASSLSAVAKANAGHKT